MLSPCVSCAKTVSWVTMTEFDLVKDANARVETVTLHRVCGKPRGNVSIRVTYPFISCLAGRIALILFRLERASATLLEPYRQR